MNNTYLILDELISMLPVILCGCVLPITFIWMETRRKMNETNARTQIVTAALEKNPDMDLARKSSRRPWRKIPTWMSRNCSKRFRRRKSS